MLAPADLILGEGDGYVDLPVSLSAAEPEPVSVDYADLEQHCRCRQLPATVTMSAPSTDTLNFAPGETTKVVRVQILDCNDTERFDAFTFELNTPSMVRSPRASSRICIVDNDTIVATPRLLVRDAVVDEKDGFASSPSARRTGGQASNSTVTVDYATANGTATAGSDYTPSQRNALVRAGETAKTVVIPITDDGVTEPTESFALTLSNPTHATISDRSGAAWIGASDGTATSQPRILAPADAIVGEADGFVDLVVQPLPAGPEPAQGRLRRLQQHCRSPATACNGDFGAVDGALIFAPGETTKVVRVADHRLQRRGAVRCVHLRARRTRERRDHKGERPDRDRRQRHRRRDPACLRAGRRRR